MNRLIARAVLVAGLLAVTIAVPAGADTVGDNGNQDIAVGQSDDGTVSAQLDRDNFSGAVTLAVRLGSSTQIDCGDGSTGWIYTDFYGSGVPDTYAFGRRLSSASASGTLAGTLSTSNTCDGSETQVTESHLATLAMTGSPKLTTTTTQKTVAHNPDGTRTTFTYKTTQAAATGSVTIDNASTAITGYIEHREFSTRIQ
jgi:hypothetical protein